MERNLLPGNLNLLGILSGSSGSSCESNDTDLSDSRALAEALICRQVVSSAKGGMLKPFLIFFFSFTARKKLVHSKVRGWDFGSK